MNRALWVTGVGLVTPLGRGVEATWTRLARGDRAIGPVKLFDASNQRAGIAAEVDAVVVPSEPPGGWSRTSAMALAAAREAIDGAKLDPKHGRVGLVVGGTTGGMFETEPLLARLNAEADRPGRHVEWLCHPLSATADRLEEALGPFARVRSVSSACASGAHAIIIAAAWLLSGEIDAVVAGGSDGLSRLTLTGFNSLSAIDPEPCRPFDLRRRGTNLGEGAGFLVLERAARAVERRARPVAKLAGWACGSEAYHITHPAPDGAVVGAMVQAALSRAGLGPGDVDYVNAHGTGTVANDAMEAAALRLALGGHVGRVPVSSCKAQIGHTLGAAGAIEAAVTALVVERGVLVATAGLEQPDPALGLLHVPREGRRPSRVRAAISNAFGFGGMGAVLVFTEASDSALSRKPAPVRPHEGPAGEAAWTSPRAAPPARVAAVGGVPGAMIVVTGAAILGPCGRLGVAECANLAPTSIRSRGPALADGYLDEDRARRLDRMARLAVVVVEHALHEAGAEGEGSGVILGSAFGNVDACAAFLRPIFERGPRAASPAAFPNLVPSSPVGHVAIYAGLKGPTFATADLAASGSTAFVLATQLVAAGDASRIVAGASEPESAIGDRVLRPVFGPPIRPMDPLVDLAAAVVVEGHFDACARRGPLLARAVQVIEWRGEGLAALRELRPPQSTAAEVVLARASDEAASLIGVSRWRDLATLDCASILGESHALDAAALAIAASRVGTGRSPEALVLGLAKGRGCAVVLAPA
ncbi:MAG: beta-ketoacyl-[acyl-carrier-protein] synthase family protein [Polyangiaceae bacterium]